MFKLYTFVCLIYGSFQAKISSSSFPPSYLEKLSSMIPRLSATLKSTSVSVLIFSTVSPLATSFRITPLGVNSNTACSVISKLTHLGPVTGKSVAYLNFLSPYLSVNAISTIIFLTELTKSIAPPIPLTILPGMIQFDKSPLAPTWSAPRIVISK